MHNLPLLNEEISLEKLSISILDLPQKEQFVSGIGVRKSRQTIMVQWTSKEGYTGFGECSCRPDPYYSDEFIKGGIQLIKDFIVPHLKDKQTYKDLLQLLGKIRGWNFTKASVEAAAFQAMMLAKPNLPIFGGLKASPINQVPVGISLGIQPDKATLQRVVENALAEGYRRLKFKISPKTDLKAFEAIRPLLEQAPLLGFDANGSLSSNDLELLQYFASYNVAIEQPFAPDRFDDYLWAKEQIPNLKICLDEEVKNIGDLIKVHHLGAIDELNLKIGRVGGIAKSLEIMAYCEQHSIPCWIGGMFETGIGRALNLRFASHLPQAKAHDLSPSSRYFLEDIVSPAIDMDKGYIDINTVDAVRAVPELVKKYMVFEEVFEPDGVLLT